MYIGSASTPPFPDTSGTLDSLRLSATFRMRPNLSLLASYWYERYDSANWALDGVSPGTVPNVLNLGEQSPRYHVNVIRLATQYRF